MIKNETKYKLENIINTRTKTKTKTRKFIKATKTLSLTK